MGDLIIANKDLEKLEADKKVLIEKHRDTISQLIDFGVNETQKDSHKRSETYNEILNPIENEIQNIAEKISDIREDFDMQKSPKEILESRLNKLKELCFINVTDFLNTETGKNFLEMIKPKNPDEVAHIQLDEKDPVKYSSYIFRYCDTNKRTSEITEKIEYKDFVSRHIKIVKLMDKVDSKLMDVNRGN